MIDGLLIVIVRGLCLFVLLVPFPVGSSRQSPLRESGWTAPPKPGAAGTKVHWLDSGSNCVHSGQCPGQGDLERGASRFTIAAGADGWWTDDDVRAHAGGVDANPIAVLEVSGGFRGRGLSIDTEFEHVESRALDAPAAGGLYEGGRQRSRKDRSRPVTCWRGVVSRRSGPSTAWCARVRAAVASRVRDEMGRQRSQRQALSHAPRVVP